MSFVLGLEVDVKVKWEISGSRKPMRLNWLLSDSDIGTWTAGVADVRAD